MSKGNSRDGVLGKRSVLSDLTNRYGNTSVPSLARTVNKTPRYEEGLETGIENSKFTDNIFRCPGSLRRGKEKVGCAEGARISLKGGDRKAPSFLDNMQPQRSPTSGHTGSSIFENAGLDLLHCFQAPRQLSSSSACDISSDSAVHELAEIARLKNKSASFGSVSGEYDEREDWSPESDEDAQGFDEDENAGLFMPTEKERTKCSAKNYNNINLALSEENIVDGCDSLTQDMLGKSPSKGCSRPTGAPKVQLTDLGGLTSMHGTDNGHSTNKVENGMGSDKACSCSLCHKAAYMWTDLHYQDARGRLAAINKSKRLVRSLEGKCCNHDQSEKLARDNYTKAAQLEVDLLQHWRLLFNHTENVLARESSQLHSSLLKLKELRGNCKRDLEAISVVPADN